MFNLCPYLKGLLLAHVKIPSEYALSTPCLTLSAQNYDYIRNLLSHNALMFHVLLLRVCFESFVYDHSRLLPPMG